MAIKFSLVLAMLTAITLAANAMASATRDHKMAVTPGHNLAARLMATKNDGGLVECWNALVELKACSNEIVLFFLDGETTLGPKCCATINMISRHCWPELLSSLGFTNQEGDILMSYCDGAVSPAHSPQQNRSNIVN